MLIGVCRIGGFGFDFKNAGFTFVYVLGRQLIVFDLDAEKQIYRCHDMKLDKKAGTDRRPVSAWHLHLI
jgi:hypothetical protein